MEQRKLWKTVVKIYKGERRWSRDGGDSYTVEEVEVAAENETYIIINDWYFTKLEKKKRRSDDYGDYVNHPSIRISVNDRWLDNGVFYTLYSTSKKRPSTIRSEILAAVRDKQGWLAESLDLDFIK